MMSKLLICGGLLLCSPAIYAEQQLSLQLASVYQTGTALSGFLLSEKFDGIRVFWDGQKARTRSGQWLALPAPLLAQLPDFAIEAELWLGYGRFSELQSLLAQSFDDPRWSQLQLMVFDAPRISGSFEQRWHFMQRHLNTSPQVQLVRQTELINADQLQRQLEAVERRGGEGLMLHARAALYQSGRVAHLLKVKSRADAEARVIAHLPGKGQFADMMGALRVELPDGRQFKLGSGFNHAERQTPPAIGSWVRFQYQGVTKNGIPRFAVFKCELTDVALTAEMSGTCRNSEATPE